MIADMDNIQVCENDDGSFTVACFWDDCPTRTEPTPWVGEVDLASLEAAEECVRLHATEHHAQWAWTTDTCPSCGGFRPWL